MKVALCNKTSATIGIQSLMPAWGVVEFRVKGPSGADVIPKHDWTYAPMANMEGDTLYSDLGPQSCTILRQFGKTASETAHPGYLDLIHWLPQPLPPGVYALQAARVSATAATSNAVKGKDGLQRVREDFLPGTRQPSSNIVKITVTM